MQDCLKQKHRTDNPEELIMNNRYTRIAVIGTHCTGKTTLAKALSKTLDIPLIKECARNHEIKKASPRQYVEIQKHILTEQISAELKYPGFVSDRSTIDNLAYWLHSCASIADAQTNKTYIRKALNNARNYTHVFLLIPEFYPREDGFRNTNIIYQLQIAETINAILYLQKIPHQVLSGSIEERLQHAISIMHGFDKNNRD